MYPIFLLTSTIFAHIHALQRRICESHPQLGSNGLKAGSFSAKMVYGFDSVTAEWSVMAAGSVMASLMTYMCGTAKMANGNPWKIEKWKHSH